MFDNRKRTKIQNSKIQCWRVEIAEFIYTISYRPGHDNIVPDALTRAHCAAVSKSNLVEIHNNLCNPGVTRLLHFVRSKNLPFSTEEIKKVCANCQICCELKPRFYQPACAETLIKSLHPMDRLSIDFNGLLPSSTNNKYILTVVDEYSRFPFAFPCPDISTTSVIKCLEKIFSLCGFPTFIHSDRGSSFVSNELKTYLTERRVATSRRTFFSQYPACHIADAPWFHQCFLLGRSLLFLVYHADKYNNLLRLCRLYLLLDSSLVPPQYTWKTNRL